MPSYTLTNPRGDTVTVSSLPEFYSWRRRNYTLASGTDAAAVAAFGGAADNPGPLETYTGDALKAAYVPRGQAFTGLMAGLRSGTSSVGMSLVGDSTGDAADEWFYLVGSWLAGKFPAWTVQMRRWNDTAQWFDRPLAIQTGPAGQRAIALATGATIAAVTSPVANPTGDLDAALWCKPTTWRTGTQTLISKFGGSGNRSFRFQINASGVLSFDWTADGSTLQSAASSVTAVPFAEGAAGWVRVQLDVDDGAGGHTVKFSTSTDGATWTQLGATVTRATGATSVFASTWPYELGARSGSSEPLIGGARLYEAEIREGIGGATICPRLADDWQIPTGTGAPAIEGAPVLTLVGGSHPGAAISYLNDPVRVKKMTPDFSQAVVMFSDSHNEQRTTGTPWATILGGWVAAVRARLPLAVPVVLTQNPRKAPAVLPEHVTRRAQTLLWAQANGVAAVDTYQAFLDSPLGLDTLVNSDGLHPTQGAGNTGSQLWANTITAQLAAA